MDKNVFTEIRTKVQAWGENEVNGGKWIKHIMHQALDELDSWESFYREDPDGFFLTLDDAYANLDERTWCVTQLMQAWKYFENES